MPTTSHVLRNAKGREKVRTMLADMAARVGATIDSEEYDREIVAHISLDGARCMVIPDAHTARHNFFAGHWHFDHDKRNGRLYRDGFDGAGYRAHHKATTATETAEDLCIMLEARFGWIKDGSAFVTEKEDA